LQDCRKNGKIINIIQKYLENLEVDRMKMILAILKNDDEQATIAELNKKHYFVTKLSTTGGFLKQGNTSLLIGVDDNKVDEVCEILKKMAGVRNEVQCLSSYAGTDSMYPGVSTPYPIDVQEGGVTIFVLPVEQCYKI
jgi:uncharacterized protein YaaQ